MQMQSQIINLSVFPCRRRSGMNSNNNRNICFVITQRAKNSAREKKRDQGHCHTWGRFHQTLCAKQKDAGTRRLAKKFAVQFHQLIVRAKIMSKFA